MKLDQSETGNSNLAAGLRHLAEVQRQVSAMVPDTITEEVTNPQVTTVSFALSGEVFELAQKLGWKPWKANYAEFTNEERSDIAEEYADILAFLGLLTNYVCQRTGLTIEDLATAYQQKTLKNIRRFNGEEGNGYGFWAEKPWEEKFKSLDEYLEKGRKLKAKVIERQETGDLLTFAEAGKMLRMNLDEIETLVEDNDDLGFNIGIQIPGVGYSVSFKGEYTIEYTGD